MKFNNLVNNFTAGEWSDKMAARTDTDQYIKACAKMENFIPLLQGGAFMRSGTRHVPISTQAGIDLYSTGKLIPYNPSSGVPYLLMANQITASTWHVWDIENETTSGITTGTGAATTSVPGNFFYTQIGDIIMIVDGAGTSIPLVFYLKSGTFYLRTVLDYMYTESQLNQAWWKALPYRDLQANGISINMTVNVASGSGRTLSASGGFFDPGHVGAIFKITSAGNTGAVQVTAYVDATHATVTWIGGVGTTAVVGTAAGTAWEESAWSDYRGWPRTITAFEGRMVYGGNSTAPDTIWGSRIGSVFDMMEVPFAQDDAFTTYASDNGRPYTMTPSASEVSNIMALSSSKTLVINTDKYEIVANGSQGAMGPLDVQFQSSTAYGSHKVQPVRVGNYTTFVQRGGLKIRDVIFNFQEDQYKSTDLSFPADHLFLRDDHTTLNYATVKEMCSTRYDSILWILQNSYQLIGVTLDRDYQVNGFFRFSTKNADQTSDAIIYAICAAGKNLDTLYMMTLRTPSGRGAELLLEQLTPMYQFSDQALTSRADAVGAPNGYQPFQEYMKGPTYLDCWRGKNLSVSGARTTATSFAGFDHLNGYTVAVIADGHYIGTQVVAGGLILTTDPAQVVLAGIPYDATLKTLPIENGQSMPGTTQGLIRRVDEAYIKFWKSYGAKYGVSEDALDDVPFLDNTLDPSDPPVMETSTVTVSVPDTFDRGSQIVVKQTNPWPCNILAIISRGMTGG